MEKKVKNQANGYLISPKSGKIVASSSSVLRDSDDLILPTLNDLKQSQQLQQQVHCRLQELQLLGQQDKYKSQCWGSTTVWCKREVPWSHNYIL